MNFKKSTRIPVVLVPLLLMVMVTLAPSETEYSTLRKSLIPRLERIRANGWEFVPASFHELLRGELEYAEYALNYQPEKIQDRHHFMMKHLSSLFESLEKQEDPFRGRSSRHFVSFRSAKETATKTPDTYSVILPPGYSGSTPAPVVIFLHGSHPSVKGDGVYYVGGGPVCASATALKDRNFILLLPQKPDETTVWDVSWLDRFWEDAGRRFLIDPQRVTLGGFSMGGFGTWRWAVAHPNRFAGLFPIAGWGDTHEAPRLKNTPVWIFHGLKDDSVGVWESDRMNAALQNAQGTVRYTVNPEIAHKENWALDDPNLWAWIQTLSRPANEAEISSETNGKGDSDEIRWGAEASAPMLAVSSSPTKDWYALLGNANSKLDSQLRAQQQTNPNPLRLRMDSEGKIEVGVPVSPASASTTWPSWHYAALRVNEAQKATFQESRDRLVTRVRQAGKIPTGEIREIYYTFRREESPCDREIQIGIESP